MPADIVREINRTVLAGVTAFGVTYLVTPLVRIMAVRLGLITKPL